MTFFENAQHFAIHGAEMNDVKGNYTRNETRTAANNVDSHNQYIASMVAMGNMEARTATVGAGHNNNIAFANNRMMLGVTGLTPDAAKLLQTLQLPSTSSMTTQTSTVNRMQRAPQSYTPTSRGATPPSAVSKSLAFLEGIPADFWTPEMLAALSNCVASIESTMQGKGKH